MKIYDVSRLPPMITLGYAGENNWRPNRFDCSSLLTNHPNGVITLWLLPEGETQAYPVALDRDGNTVVWTPLSEEMTAATGALQIVCTDGTDVGKSAVVMFRVDESILPGADHPAAVPSWATQVMEQYQDAVEHYPQIIDSTWHVWDVENETWEDTGVSAQGVDGEDGHSPYIALNGHWMVYSDSTHEWIDTGVPASVDEAVIANAVATYLDEHPITVTETDPTVPAWAKNPTKPTYTAQEVGALPADTPIPAAVTEQTVAGWGFTKNAGTYSKPSGGIPKSDLASDVQTSLGKADTALQEHQSLAGYATETYVQQQIAAIPDELPSVSASDNGKVLGVVNGAWAAKADEGGGGGSGLSDDAKAALLDCFENVAWIGNNGSALYNALYDALYPPQPEVPDGYTQYDYIKSAKTTSLNLDARNTINLKVYDNIFAHNVELEFGFETGVGQYTNLFFGGQNNPGGSSPPNNTFAFSVNAGGLSMHANGKYTNYQQNIPNVPKKKNIARYFGAIASPSSYQANDETPYSIAWASGGETLETQLSVCGIRNYYNVAATLVPYVLCGKIKVMSLSGELQENYIPCVRDADGVIGLYETVEGVFYTTSQPAWATIGNASCYYAVGNWES